MNAWPGAWVCSCFRNESDILSSQLIREAVAVTRWFYGEPPALGMVSFVDTKHVRRKRDWGRCYLRAGWTRCGTTKGGLVALSITASDMPDAEMPLNQTLSLLEAV